MTRWPWLVAFIMVTPFFFFYYQSPVIIRLAIESDQIACYKIMVTTIRTNYSDFLKPRAISQEIDIMKKKFRSFWVTRRLATHYCAVATHDHGTVVGFIMAHLSDDESISLDMIFVHPAHQKHGIGSKLYQSMVDDLVSTHDQLKKVQSTVHKDNKAAEKFHQRIGFNHHDQTPSNDMIGQWVTREKELS